MPAVNMLTGKGWAVQLVHNKEEPNGETHGFILIKDGAGEVLVDCKDFQHNRQDYYMPRWEKQLAELLSPVPEAGMAKAEAKDLVRGDSANSEASTTDPEKEP